MLYPRKLCKFKKQQSVSLWNFLVNTLLLHIPLLTLTDGQRNKYTRCTWAGGTFFQLCCCVNFWLWWKQFQVILTYHASCAVVSFFCCGEKKFSVAQVSFMVVAGNSFRCYFLTYLTIPVVLLCQCFGCGGKQFLVTQFLRKILIQFL